jgi:hypothetical protein
MFFEFMFIVILAMGVGSAGHRDGVEAERTSWCKVLTVPDCTARGVKALTNE